MLLYMIPVHSVSGQKVLLLQKAGNKTRYFYKCGDKINLRLGTPEFGFSGVITHIDDSLITIDKAYSYRYSMIHQVIRPRHFFVRNWYKMVAASIFYFGGSLVNRGIHSEKPLFDNTLVPVSGSLAIAGGLFYKFRYKKCDLSDRWRIKVLDFETFNESLPIQMEK